MEVISIKEQEDGSAIIELEMTVEEQKLFIEVGVIHCLRESLKNFEKDLGEKCD